MFVQPSSVQTDGTLQRGVGVCQSRLALHGNTSSDTSEQQMWLLSVGFCGPAVGTITAQKLISSPISPCTVSLATLIEQQAIEKSIRFICSATQSTWRESNH